MPLVTLETDAVADGDSFWIKWSPTPREHLLGMVPARVRIRKDELAQHAIHSSWQFSDVDRVVPLETAKSDPVPAFVNCGRWIAQCDVCNGAQLASRLDHRFFCVKCLNATHGGAFRRVTWPKNADEIERVLLARPNPDNRNWLPSETVADLERENVERLT